MESTGLKGWDKLLIFATFILVALAIRAATQTLPLVAGSVGRPTPVGAIPAWKSLTHDSPQYGSDSARLKIVYFTDYACPACRSDQADVESLLKRYDGDLAIAIQFFPAVSDESSAAARAALCAHEQGHFRQFHERVLALKELSAGWDSSLPLIAAAAGVPDTTVLKRCMESKPITDAIENALTHAEELGVRGTPSYIIDGRLYEARAKRIRKVIEDALSLSGGL